MYAEIDKQWLSTKGESLNKKFHEEYPNEEDNGRYHLENVKERVEVSEITDGKILLDIDSQLGFISLEWKPEQETLMELIEQQDKLDGNLLIRVIELVQKKMNKLKAVIESVKGL